MRQYSYFGPFPKKYEDIASQKTILAILYLIHEIPPSKATPFCWTTEREVCREDKEFIRKIMKIDWRDRPTAKELLNDSWFTDRLEEL
jgi:hypothetical protein